MENEEPSVSLLEVGHPGDTQVDIEVLNSVPKDFCIDSEEHANWLIRKIIAARHYAERVKTWCEHEQRRAAREEQALMFLFGRQIEAWTKSEIEKLKGKRKSINLPAGCIGLRTVAPRLIVDDEPAVLSWCKHHLPSAVIVTEKLSKSVINEHAEKLGVIPDEGVHFEPSSERFYIR